MSSPPLSCNMNVGLWLFLAAWFPFTRLILAIGHTVTWVRRSRKLSKTKAKRFPVVPIVSWLLFLLYSIFFILTSLNRTRIALNLFIYGLGWCVFGVAFLLYLRKFVSVGHRISPRTKQMHLNEEVENLSKFDWFGRFVFNL